MSLPRTVSAACATLCIPTAALLGTLATHASAAADIASARHGALAAAPRIARDVLSYDYRTISRDVARATAESTGAFARQYASSSAELETLARQAQAIVQASPHDAGIVSASATHVVVLLFVDQVSVRRTPNAATPTTRVEQSRVQMTLANVDGHWRLAQLAAL